jgi:hypothetical protein
MENSASVRDSLFPSLHFFAHVELFVVPYSVTDSSSSRPPMKQNTRGLIP